MNQIQNKYVILGSLCALVLTLVVGYAAFSTVLKIKGTSTINSNWDVKITGIEKLEGSKGVDKAGTPTYDNEKGLSATFNTSFTTPGEYATYKIEITNNGSLDAVLKNITIPENTNNDIIFYLNKNQNNEDITEALTQNSTLFKTGETGNIGYVYVTVLYKDYEDQQTAQDKTSNMTITFDFEQATGNVSGGIASDYTGVLYSKNVIFDTHFEDETWKREKLIWPGDSVDKIKEYAKEDNSTLGNYYLKHIMNNGRVESNEVCFITDTEHCMKPNEYETSKALIQSQQEWFGTQEGSCRTDCSFGDPGSCCTSSSLVVYATTYGAVHVDDDSSVVCYINDDGSAYSYEIWHD